MKPHVICHMMAPLDGRLLVDNWAPEGSPLRQALMDDYQRLHKAFEADAWLAGTRTMEEFAEGEPAPRTPATPPERPWHRGDAGARRFAIAIDRSARLHWGSATADEGHVVVVLPKKVEDAHLAELAAAGVSYLVMPADEIDLRAALEQLNERLGIRSVLLEGGAKINGAFLEAGLVDEVSLLLAPLIDGTSDSPTIFENGERGLAAKLKLELQAADRLKSGALHLRYRVSTQASR